MLGNLACFSTVAVSYNCFHVRWVYEGVIDDPYGEFFIAENKSLQKVPLHFANIAPSYLTIVCVLY